MPGIGYQQRGLNTFSRGKHVSEQAFLYHQRQNRHPQRGPFHQLMRLGVKQFIACGPEHPDPHKQQNSANNELCTVFETQMTVMMIDIRGFLTLFIRNQNDKVGG